MKKKIKFLTVTLFIFFVVFAYGKKISNPTLNEEIVKGNTITNENNWPTIALQEMFYIENNFNNAVAHANNTEARNSIQAIVVPHHLVPSVYISEMMKRASGREIKNIVLIGPNHENVGMKAISSIKANWKTPFGSLSSNEALVDKFSADFNLQESKEIFTNEHSVGAHVSFIKYYYPEAEILPITISSYAGMNEVQKVSDWLVNNLHKDSLLIFSVDFSHYLTRDNADIKDEETRDLILSNNIEKILTLNNDYVDSPVSLAIALRFGKMKNLNTNIVKHGNSFDFSNVKPVETTSYFGIALEDETQSITPVRQNSKKPVNVNLLFLGDLMLDRYIGEKIKTKGIDYLFEKINSQEIFFENYDLISSNLEGAVTNKGEHYPPKLSNDFAFDPDAINKLKDYGFNFFNISNNHLSDQGEKGITETRENLKSLGINFSGCRDGKVDECSIETIEINNSTISLMGLSAIYKQFDLLKASNVIEKASQATDFLVVNIHWGSEYTHKHNITQQNIAHKLVDAGADIIIGHHPHVIQGIEIYKEKAIFYSLGNFIFDQPESDFPPDNSESLAINIEIKNNKKYIKLLPLKFKSWQLETMDNEEGDLLIENIINWSKLEDKYINQIKKGSLEL